MTPFILLRFYFHFGDKLNGTQYYKNADLKLHLDDLVEKKMCDNNK